MACCIGGAWQKGTRCGVVVRYTCVDRLTVVAAPFRRASRNGSIKIVGRVNCTAGADEGAVQKYLQRSMAGVAVAKELPQVTGPPYA
jgi:hypothetical protein